MVFEAGVGGRPTLVQNVETLAHVALLARFGATWFRSQGTAAEPGTALFTVSGAVAAPGVVEAPLGVSLVSLIEAVGGASRPLQAVLLGGYHGAWLSWDQAAKAVMTSADLAARGARLGAGVMVALAADQCGVLETARVLRYLAGESAGQCGPCVHGLPRLAARFDDVAESSNALKSAAAVERDARLLIGRGSCHHPDGTVAFARSALTVFRHEVELHGRGRCSAPSSGSVLPT